MFVGRFAGTQSELPTFLRLVLTESGGGDGTVRLVLLFFDVGGFQPKLLLPATACGGSHDLRCRSGFC